MPRSTHDAHFDPIDTSSDVTRPSKPAVPATNRMLAQLADSDRQTLLADADRVALPVGYIFARPGDAIASAYFPETGVFSIVSEMTTGHQLAIATIGAEGVIGLASLFGASHYTHRIVVLADSSGYRIPAGHFRRAFEQSPVFRAVTLAHIGGRMSQLVIEAACNRTHSHRQRLARCLLVMSDKAGQRSLRVTHEMLAQMVGGPRHAVTVALSELRVKGAIAHLRGRIDIVNRSVLVRQACECYGALAQLDHR
jgi:CRP-like cAMP-binding protein